MDINIYPKTDIIIIIIAKIIEIVLRLSSNALKVISKIAL